MEMVGRCRPDAITLFRLAGHADKACRALLFLRLSKAEAGRGGWHGPSGISASRLGEGLSLSVLAKDGWHWRSSPHRRERDDIVGLTPVTLPGILDRVGWPSRGTSMGCRSRLSRSSPWQPASKEAGLPRACHLGEASGGWKVRSRGVPSPAADASFRETGKHKNKKRSRFDYFCPPYSNAVSSVEEKFQAAS